MALALRREPSTTGGSIRARAPRHQTVVKPALAVVPKRRRWPAVVGALAWTALFGGLLGAAVFHTQLAERQLRIDRLDRAVAEQRELFDDLRYQRAELRSPVRLAEAAGALGMGRGDSSDFVRVDARGGRCSARRGGNGRRHVSDHRRHRSAPAVP